MKCWEIFAESDGALIVERRNTGWYFTATGKVGRPPKAAPALPYPASPLDLLPPGIDIERLNVVAS